MGKLAVSTTLEDRMASLKQQHGGAIQVDDLSSVVGSLVQGTAVGGEKAPSIADDVQEMLQYISAAKGELGSLNAKSLSNRDIPDATLHLDEIVNATEKAADTIMSAADTVTEVAGELEGEQSEKLMEVTTHLFEASTFQDLTGQRITKVERILATLEERLNALADAIGDDYIEPPEDEIEKDEEGVAVHDEDLLNGPQHEGMGNSQDEIDALLAMFD